MQTMQQRRAAAALNAVQAHQNQSYSGELRSYLHALPAMIHMNGLGQACAFIRGKAGPAGKESGDKAIAYQTAYNLLSNWLCAAGQPYARYDDLLTGITHDDMHRYRLAQAEAQAYLDWVKKFAAAYLSAGSNGAESQNP
jgi:CRISPR-associated protein Cmr5